MKTNLAIEGEPAPRFAVYVCNLDDEPCQRVAEYNQISDVLGTILFFLPKYSPTVAGCCDKGQNTTAPAYVLRP